MELLFRQNSTFVQNEQSDCFLPPGNSSLCFDAISKQNNYVKNIFTKQFERAYLDGERRRGTFVGTKPATGGSNAALFPTLDCSYKLRKIRRTKVNPDNSRWAVPRWGWKSCCCRRLGWFSNYLNLFRCESFVMVSPQTFPKTEKNNFFFNLQNLLEKTTHSSDGLLRRRLPIM